MMIYIETYGCTANKSDERLLIGLLNHKGHQIVQTMDDADVLVLVTCTVIGTTEQRMLSRLKVFHKKKKKIIVTGCMPSVQAELIRSIVPDATLLPTQHIQHINDVVEGNVLPLTKTDKTMLPKLYNGTIAPMLIAEGCMNSCAYCITHVARGKLRSFPVRGIVADVRSALSQGCKEIQLTAQDTASYGRDIGTDLGALLKQVCSLDESFRIRVGMMNPVTLKENLMSILSAYQHEKIYKFLHVPVQSGDDDILDKMKRGYTAKEFILLVERFRKAFPALVLSTDVIIGFPTETEEQFDRTIQLLKLVEADIVNITRFSARPHTAAKKIQGRIPTHIVKDRSKRASELCSELSLKKNQRHIGNIYNVLVTEKGKHSTFTGRAENYKQVVVRDPVTIGECVQVEIVDAAPTYLVGKLI